SRPTRAGTEGRGGPSAALLDVVHELVAFHLELVEPGLDDVPDADDAGQPAVHDDRQVADPPVGHRPGERLELVLRAAGDGRGGHEVADVEVLGGQPRGVQPGDENGRAARRKRWDSYMD